MCVQPRIQKARLLGRVEWGRRFEIKGASRGMGNPSWLRVYGSIMSSHSGVRGRAPAENRFQCFPASQNATISIVIVGMLWRRLS